MEVKILKKLITLHEEQLDIYKKLVQTGEVIMHKEVFLEEKTIKVPVYSEELVIEMDLPDTQDSNYSENHTEIMRIPISEERIEIIKHAVVLEDVQIYKHKFEEVKHIEETIKKETLAVKTTDGIEIIDEIK